VRSLSPQQRRVVQPLLDAGLGWEQIGSLVFRLAFDTVVADGDAPGRASARWSRVRRWTSSRHGSDRSTG
jgi:hypothetical protein